jgi:hypothetical protein
MNSTSYTDRKSVTVPFTSKSYRLLMWKPCWAIISLMRFKYDQSKNQDDSHLIIENCSIPFCLGHELPLVITGHYVHPYHSALKHIVSAEFLSSSDLILTDFIEKSIIATYKEYISSAGPILGNDKYGSWISQLYLAWNAIVAKFDVTPRRVCIIYQTLRANSVGILD